MAMARLFDTLLPGVLRWAAVWSVELGCPGQKITTLPSQNPLGRLKKCKLADVDSDSPLFVDALGDQGMWGTQALPTVLNLPLSVIGPAEFTVNRCQDPPMQTLLQQ
ncbi:hypothetical protein Bbelb_313380 [Branchiostoma belcheri]|nr:hypothetical protein Bbelb_313380 [Branchiostoma belcheri]